jgi:aryl-alcohol dehydrogenase-like predicted oxidoreductase
VGDSLRINLRLAGLIWEIADRRSAAPSAVAIAWLLRRSPRVIPIPGARRVPHLEQDLTALELELTAEELNRLEAVVGAGKSAAGGRLPQRPHNRAGSKAAASGSDQ